MLGNRTLWDHSRYVERREKWRQFFGAADTALWVRDVCARKASRVAPQLSLGESI